MILKFLRLLRILAVFTKYGLDEIAVTSINAPRTARLMSTFFFWRRITSPRAIRLRQALEELGPIFVKFGQVLSTRRDLMPQDIADELALLQDRVPPFDSDLAIAQITRSLGAHPDQLFAHFEREPVASASIAQVHFARLKNGKDVAVKVLRPGMKKLIDEDIALMHMAASLIERVWGEARRLKPREVVGEFDKYLHDELDLMREAANAAQLRRNFANSTLLMVPEMYWDYCSSSVIVMERMRGIPVSQIERLAAEGVDLKKLSSDGVEIFFTQVFRDGFFHADMHPGNILVSIEKETFGRYIALDFGIVGTLNDFDKDYLSQNFLAFFRRDYKRVAEAHIESGWAPPTTFNVEVQPQLVLLQKTLLNIEGLGRQLDPDLDLWKTAKPYLERWMSEQVGWQGFVEKLRAEAPRYAHIFPQFPRLLHQALARETHPHLANPNVAHSDLLAMLVMQQRRTNRLLGVLAFLLGGSGVAALGFYLLQVHGA